ncbi:MAG: hypothetical protein WA162_00995 [Thermodesulfobacteriota bacterium]
MLAYLIIYFLVFAALGLIPAFIAKGIGRSFFAWWIYGTVLLAPALIHAVILKLRQGRIRCMFCGKTCWANATHCDKCGYEFIRF